MVSTASGNGRMSVGTPAPHGRATCRCRRLPQDAAPRPGPGRDRCDPGRRGAASLPGGQLRANNGCRCIASFQPAAGGDPGTCQGTGSGRGLGHRGIRRPPITGQGARLSGKTDPDGELIPPAGGHPEFYSASEIDGGDPERGRFFRHVCGEEGNCHRMKAGEHRKDSRTETFSKRKRR